MKLRDATIEIGKTGKDWEPDAAAAFFAQIITPTANWYAFGPTEEAAWANLLTRINEARGE